MKLLLPHQRIIEAHTIASAAYKSLYHFGDISACWYSNNVFHPDGFKANKKHVQNLANQLGLSLKVITPKPLVEFIYSPLIIPKYLLNFLNELFRLNTRRDVVKRWKAKIISLAEENESYSIFTTSLNTPQAIAFKSLNKKSIKVEIQHGLLDKSYFPIEADIFYLISKDSYELCMNNNQKEKIKLLSDSIKFPHGQIKKIYSKSIRKVCFYSKNPGGGCSYEFLKSLERQSYLYAKKINADYEFIPHPRDNFFKLFYRHGLKSFVFKKQKLKKYEIHSDTLVISSCSTSFITNTKRGEVMLNIRPENKDHIRDKMYSKIPSYSFDDLYTAKSFDVFHRES